MRQTPEVAKGDIVIQHRGDEYIALIVGWPEYEGRSTLSQVRAIQALNVELWREQFEKRKVRDRAWRDLKHLFRQSIGLPTWWPSWAIDKERRAAFKELVRQVAVEVDAVNKMRPGRGQRLGWPDIVLIVEGRWVAARQAERDALIEEGGMEVVSRRVCPADGEPCPPGCDSDDLRHCSELAHQHEDQG